MAAHKGPASLRPRCTRSGSSVAAIPVYQAGRTLSPGVLGLITVCVRNANGSSYCVTSVDTMNGRDVEGNGHGTSVDLAEGTEEHHEFPQSL
jgi:hypothetical protein